MLAQSCTRSLRRESQIRSLLWCLLFLVWAGLALVAVSHSSSITGENEAPEAIRVQVRELSAPFEPPQAEREMPSPQTPFMNDELERPAGSNTQEEQFNITRAHPDHSSVDHPGLQWLADHQNFDGHWDATWFGADSTRGLAGFTHNIEFREIGRLTGDMGKREANLLITSLALQSFAIHGYGDVGRSFHATISSALNWLMAQQHADGSFNGSRDVIDHAAATTALAMIADPGNVEAVGRAARNLVALQKGVGGWAARSGKVDVVATAHALYALTAAEQAGTQLSLDAVRKRASGFLQTVELDEHVLAEKAAWVVASRLCQVAVDAIQSDERTGLVLKRENWPNWDDGQIDFEYWWLRSLAFSLCDQDNRDWWGWHMQRTLLPVMRGRSRFDRAKYFNEPDLLDEYGSWDAVDSTKLDSGRVYTTAMATMILGCVERDRPTAKNQSIVQVGD